MILIMNRVIMNPVNSPLIVLFIYLLVYLKFTGTNSQQNKSHRETFSEMCC